MPRNMVKNRKLAKAISDAAGILRLQSWEVQYGNFDSRGELMAVPYPQKVAETTIWRYVGPDFRRVQRKRGVASINYEIVTDSSANLTDEMIEQYGIHIVPLSYRIGGDLFGNRKVHSSAVKMCIG